MENHIKKYNAAIYVRLSKEDGDLSDAIKPESNSISNQKQLIKDFLKDKKDIVVVSERVDDGHTGSNFERPAFQLMLKDIENGRVDCVVVKDLSRLGREYIYTGKLLEQVFPALGVRCIAINDNYDSLNSTQGSNDIVIPFTNLMNDAYCRDISIKIRSNLESKRKEGQYIGSFTPYGYKKSEKERNKMVVDEYAAAIVQDIFRWKIAGMSQDTIAKKLNDRGILSPMEYKNSLGLRYGTAFKKNKHSLWTGVAVKRILESEVYIGNLVQGKRTTPNHKVKKEFVKNKDEWIIVKNTHEAIVSKENFDLVQKLLLLDMRVAPSKQSVYLLSGIVVCGDCGNSMVRKMSTVGGKKYSYYICSQYKNCKTCSSHRISEKELETTVLSVLQEHIRLVLDMENCLKYCDNEYLRKIDIKNLSMRIQEKEEEIVKYDNLKVSLYEDMRTGFVSKDDYLEIREQFEKKRQEAEAVLFEYDVQFKDLEQGNSSKQMWLDKFRTYHNLTELSRTAVVELIDNIQVYEDKRIEVQFAHWQDFSELMRREKEANIVSKSKGVI